MSTELLVSPASSYFCLASSNRVLALSESVFRASMPWVLRVSADSLVVSALLVDELSFSDLTRKIVPTVIAAAISTAITM